MAYDTDAGLKAILDGLEQRIDERRPPKELAPELRELVDKIAEESPHRARALRLRGIVLNRLKDPKGALDHLHRARRAATLRDDHAEIVRANREIALVHAWRGEDRDAALALLRAVAFAYLGGKRDESAIALALAEAGRLALEARRFEEAERLFRLLAEANPQPLDAFQVARIKINLCQALNRQGRHDAALQLARALRDELAAISQSEARRRLSFLARLEEARAYAGRNDLDAAAGSLAEAAALLPEDRTAFEHDELKEAEAEIRLAQGDIGAIADVKRLAKRYTDPSLTVRAANLRMLGARVLFKHGRPREAADLLAEALRDAVKAGLPDLAQRVRADMLEGDAARHLDKVLKEAGAIEALGGEWSASRQLIRIESLGEGGAGKVYRAIDLRDGQEVAVKEVSLAAFGPDRRKRIVETVRNEYAVAVTLPELPGVAKVRGLLSDPDGTLFIVQDLVKGTTLGRFCAGSPEPGKLLPLMLDVAEALGALHASGIVHRDLKPDNVMVRRGRNRDEAVLVDFGIALLDGQSDTLKRYGTAGYMAPEQARGGDVDGSADIYAFGKMIAELWARDGSAGTMPKPLAKLVAQMLAVDPNERPSADAVKAALAAAMQV
jgi:tetratricopeptide (TPR) repeat protein